MRKLQVQDRTNHRFTDFAGTSCRSTRLVAQTGYSLGKETFFPLVAGLSGDAELATNGCEIVACGKHTQ
jgi:hypothetical protein